MLPIANYHTHTNKTRDGCKQTGNNRWMALRHSERVKSKVLDE